MYRLVLFLLLTVMLRSQTYPYNNYIGLPDSGTMVWRVATWATFEGDYAQPTFPGVYDYILTGDTIINGTHYRKLYRQIVQKGTYPTQYPLYADSVEGLMGFVRNDISNKKVILEKIGNSLSLETTVLWDLSEIYPFNSYGIKSTFFADPPIVKQYPGYYYCMLVANDPINNLRASVYDVDTVHILGKDRRRYNVKVSKGCDYYLNGWFIEGIGFEKGLIDVAYVGDWDTTWRVGHDSHFDVDICKYHTMEYDYSSFSKLLCVKYDTLKHAFVPGGCDVQPPMHRSNYIPFPDDSGAVWVTKEWGNLMKWETGKPSIVNNRKYIPVFLNGSYELRYRNDTVNQVVMMTVGNSDLPLYDFSANKGHFASGLIISFGIYGSGVGDYNRFSGGWLAKIDTINVNNQIRRRYHYVYRKSNYSHPDSMKYIYNYDTLIVIEGIGFLGSPFSELWGQNVSYVLGNYTCNQTGIFSFTSGVELNKYDFICFKYKDFEYIVDTSLCELATGVLTRTKIKPEIKVLQNKIEITALNPAIIEGVKIVNVLGQSMNVPVNLIGTKYEISTTNLPPGMYIIVVNTINGIYSRKFYKQ